MALGINWDEEDARYNPPKVEKSIVQETKVDAAGDGAVAPSVLKDTVPAAAVGQAAVPPAVSTSTATGNPVPPSVPSWVTNAANAGGNALGMMAPIVNPFHYKANGEVDPYATGAHAATDLAAGYTGLKVIQGVGSGISRRISNVIGGVDPTIQAQINQSDKQAARAASQPQGKMPDPIATPRGRIEPTMAPEPPAPPAPPEVPKPPVTPAEKAALAAAEPSPYEQERHRLAKIKADKAQFEFDRIQQKANAPTAAAPAVLPEAGRTLEQTAALGKSLPSSPVAPPVSPTTPVVTPLPIETTPVAAQTEPFKFVPFDEHTPTPELAPVTKAEVKVTPEITGQAGAAVSPKQRAAKVQQTYKDTPATWQKLTKEGTTFLPGYGGGDNHLFNSYGAEGRKAILDQFNNGKPMGSYENFEKLNKEVISKGVKIADVPKLMEKLPAYGKADFGQLGKPLKIGGILGLGLAGSQLANAKNLPEAALRGVDIATDYIPGVAQFKQGMSPLELNSKEAEDLAFQRRMEAASKKGAGNRGAAYDPRKFYTPMDTGNPMFNIGVPPPR